MENQTLSYGKLHQEIKNKNTLVALDQLGKYKCMCDNKCWPWQKQICGVHLCESNMIAPSLRWVTLLSQLKGGGTKGF